MFFVSCAPHHHYFLKMIFAIKSFLKLKKKNMEIAKKCDPCALQFSPFLLGHGFL